MKVYRFLSGEELELIKSGQKEKLGRVFGKSVSNTFKYNQGQKYIHFFRRKSDIEYIKQVRLYDGPVAKYYVCEFNIPLTELIFTRGKGSYYELKGYGEVMLTEFAIKAESFNPSWLTSYQQADIFVDGPNGVGLQNQEKSAER